MICHPTTAHIKMHLDFFCFLDLVQFSFQRMILLMVRESPKILYIIFFKHYLRLAKKTNLNLSPRSKAEKISMTNMCSGRDLKRGCFVLCLNSVAISPCDAKHKQNKVPNCTDSYSYIQGNGNIASPLNSGMNIWRIRTGLFV